MEVVFFYILVAVCAFFAYKNRRKSKAGVIAIKGKSFGYVLGNYLESEGATFHGLDIHLAYSMANFYLDSHKDSRRRGPGLLFDPSQKLALEGDFNNYFQLFVPKGSHVLALSILSPDVMRTLMNSSERYDVELYNDHLRIISLKKPYGTSSEDELLAAAKAVLIELDHRASSWQDSNEPPQKLRYRKGATFKLAGVYLRRSRVFAVLSVLLLGIVGAGLWLAYYYSMQDPNFSDPYSKGVLVGTLIYVASGLVLAAIPIAMLAPFVWFFGIKPGEDSFPGQVRKHFKLPWEEK